MTRMKQIDIHYFAPSNGEKKVIPVLYDVEDQMEHCMQIIRCTVGLPNNEMPAWLYPRKFDLITHIREDMHVVDYNPVNNAELRTLDAEFFRYKVYSEILFKEQKAWAAKSQGIC